VVKKEDKNATVYNSLYSPSTLATLSFSCFHIYELLRIARPVGLLNKICGLILCIQLSYICMTLAYIKIICYMHNLLVWTWISISAILAVGLLRHTHRQIDTCWTWNIQFICAHLIIFAWNRPTNSWGIYAAKCAHFTIQKGICRPGSVWSRFTGFRVQWSRD